MSSLRLNNWAIASLALLAGLGSVPTAASAGLFHRQATVEAPIAPAAVVAEIQRALDEQRLLDAGKMLDDALLADMHDPRLQVLAGQLNLARGRYADALAAYQQVAAVPEVKGAALEGQGLALSLLGRSDEALATLKQAVEVTPSAWRAWNALGAEYDARRNWPQAEAAYERAVSESDSAPIALNNRGFSRLLQGRFDAAVSDFVTALGKKPDLMAARTNLRLAMAMRGEYDRAVAGAPQDDEAASLNNAGFAAMMRGDYPAAEDLFERAIGSKGVYYGRAATNLQLARSLETQTKAMKSATSAR